MTPSPNDDGNKQRNAILHQMDRFQAEYVERELQKRSSLQVAIVRDKICALTRKCDRATEKLFRMKKGRAADELNEVVENLERDIESLEAELRNLQEKEIQRRGKSMMTYQVMEETVESILHRLEDDDVKGAPIKAHIDVLKNTPDIINPDDYPLDVVLQVPLAPSGSICVECSITPSTHKCRRCRRFVCTLCCSEKRHLDMIWWCGDCFDNESITNQQQIRDGKYFSDGEG
jgi:exonuclease VII small subunit